MTSLSTVYFISILLASVSAFGATYVGHMVYPIKGGSEEAPTLSTEVKNLEAAAEQINTTPEPVPT